MSNFTVNLDVRNWASNGTDGYTNTTASNNAVYCFQYSGGTDGHGGVEETANAGSGTIIVTVGGDPRYKISDVTFTGDIQNQLTRVVTANSNTATITDSDTSSGDGYYSVIVSDTTANCTFACDPPIRHKPSTT
jgi:hypothetical protein